VHVPPVTEKYKPVIWIEEITSVPGPSFVRVTMPVAGSSDSEVRVRLVGETVAVGCCGG
jgi:hypothetical protein